MDASPYRITPIAGLVLLLALIVGPLRKLGRNTFGDVVTNRLDNPRMRVVVGLCTIVISLINLVAQRFGAGVLLAIVFGIAFNYDVVIVGALMPFYVVFGGLLAEAWEIVGASWREGGW